MVATESCLKPGGGKDFSTNPGEGLKFASILHLLERRPLYLASSEAGTYVTELAAALIP